MIEWRHKPIHRIHVFTEHGLSSSIMNEFFEKFREFGCKIVLDPFVGSGTVLVEAQLRDIESIGIDSNPWALLVTKAKTTWPGDVEKWIKEYLGQVEDLEPFIPSKRLKRYHAPEILITLGRIRAAVELASSDSKPILLTVLGEVAYKFSKLKKSPAPRFKYTDRKEDHIATHSILSCFLNKLLEALKDLRMCKMRVPAHLIWADSTVWLPRRIDAILTSPPFANNVDYIRHTQLSLLWMGISEAELGSLRDIQLPACEAAARKWRRGLYETWLMPYYDSIGGSRKTGFRRFLAQYLWAMNKHLELIAERLEWEAWYTIGDSVLGGGYIPTHELLAKLARRHGLKATIHPLGSRMKRGLKIFLLRLAASS